MKRLHLLIVLTTTLAFQSPLCSQELRPIRPTVRIDPELDQLLGDFLAHIGKTQLASSGKLDRVLGELTALSVSTCLLTERLETVLTNGQVYQTKFEHLMEDFAREQRQKVDQTYRLIVDRLNSGREMEPKTRILAKDLAVRIAANERSFTAIEKEVIPGLFERTEENTRNIQDIQTKLVVLEYQRKLDFKSLCDRIASLEQFQSKIMSGQHNTSGNSIIQVDFEQAGVPNLAPAPRPARIRRSWQPDAYVSASSLCPRAKLQETDYVYIANVVTNRGIIQQRRFGDIYIDCSNRVVMVLK